MSVQLQRAIDILELVQTAEMPLALGDIAQHLDLPKSATHRLLQVWVERDYLQQDAVAQRYSATLKLAILGFAHLNATGIRDVCHPELRALARDTGELARLAVVDGDTLAWVVEAQGARDGLRYDGNLGRQAVLHATAAGKSWLATMSDEEAARLVLAQGFPDVRDLPEVGPGAVRTMQALLDELARVRREGYAVAIQEASVGINAVAAVVQAGGRAVGSIIVVGPSARMEPARIAELAPRVMATARRLSALWPIRQHFETKEGSA